MSDHHYKHTQIGWVILGVIVPMAAILGAVFATAGLVLLGAVSAAALLLVAALFGSLTVSVDRKHLRARFGVGLIGKTIELDQVRSFAVMRTPWYYGWGIRLVPGGWMYNVSGLWSVELLMKDGKRCRIGTDEPEALRKAVAEVLGEPAPLTSEEAAQRKRAGRKFAAIVGAVFAVLIVAVAALFHFQGKPPTVTVGPSALGVKSLLYGGEWAWKDVTSVTLEPSLPKILLRTNGYAVGGTLRGHFKVEGLGTGELYIEARRPPFILVRRGADFVMINDADPERTRSLYGEIRDRWSAGRGAP
jgi:hypothetical protein